MKVVCSATVNNFAERNKLCGSIMELGVKPLAVKDMVYLEYEGAAPQIEKFVQLFEQYSRHNISTSGS